MARKRRAAEAALDEVRDGMVLGVGTGSTVDQLIDLIAERGLRLDAAVSSSQRTTDRLERHGVRVVSLDDVGARLELYVDGADEFDPARCLIKGGGGALTREKILAAASDRFVCICDESKRVDTLGAFPLPIEVIPLAAGLVSRQIVTEGGRPIPREGFVTDNGNAILDVHGWTIDEPVDLESSLDHLAGVVSNGLFARRPADLVLVAGDDGISRL